MTVDLTAGIVRILDSSGLTVGTGFVLTDDGLIATCAHVVESAGAGPDRNVRLVFHYIGDEITATIELDWWRDPEAEDVTILRLSNPIIPENIEPLPLGSSKGTSTHDFKTFGFPTAKSEEGLLGLWQVR